ncbi:MAG: MBL fold metallo-hydrolase [Bacteroidales bacterium]|nr:MBL fold metallo-hydrolase [Bacteroidales bacterium]MCF8403586.1 MBL fold metallo-hydrolase [Bacteroidales bacterium]
MIITLIVISVFATGTWLFIQHPQFGKLPDQDQTLSFQNSPNFQDGEFKNVSPTRMITTDKSFFNQMYDFFLKKKPRLNPTDILPSTKTDLLNLNPEENILVWFGHSSYFMQIDGKKILVDPVLSGRASPVSFFGKAYKGTDVYTAEDIPEIDYLIITHDHFDHLDYQTIKKLKIKINKVICGLGVGAHFERWGYDAGKISEKDWDETEELGDGFIISTKTARHFSGRGLVRNKSLWLSIFLKAPTLKIYIGGDSGYDTHFKEIGDKFGSIDLAILENGQYNEKWNLIHMTPGQVLQASQDLKAKRLFPVHSGKFTLAEHPWDEPLKEISRLNEDVGLNLITPIIGQKVFLDDTTHTFQEWWEGLN